MTYNTELQSNNLDLQNILNAIKTLPEAGGGEQATPTISVDAVGLITATAGTKSSIYQLAFQPAKTITPSTASQIAVSSGHYTGGDITVAAVPTQTKSVTPKATSQNITPDSGKFLSKVTVNGDSNLVAENIKSGVSIFGVEGVAEIEESIVVDDISREIIQGTIVNIQDDNITWLGAHAFSNEYWLQKVSFPSCIRMSMYTYSDAVGATILDTGSHFANCIRLTEAFFPICSNIATNAFAGCYRLISVHFPVCQEIKGLAFDNCRALTSITFPMCTSINTFAFRHCTNLSSLILGASTVCTLSNSNAFISTPYAGYKSYFSGTPYIYVPASLIDAYKSATNWVYFSSYFSTIESLEASA